MSLPLVNPDARVVLRGRTYNELAKLTRGQLDIVQPSELVSHEPTIVQVHNGTKENLLRGHCLGLGKVRINAQTSPSKFLDLMVINGETPDAAKHFGRFAVLLDDVPNDQVGRAVIRGAVWARVKAESSTVDDKFADLPSGETFAAPHALVVKARGSAELLWRDTTGEWALIVLGANPARIIVRNDSGETIPAHGVMRVTDVVDEDGVEIHEVAKPNNDFKSRYLVNTDSPIAADKSGFGTWLSESGKVLYNASAGTPAVDEEWGAKSGQWSLEKYRPGFLVTGGNDTEATTTRAWQRIVTDLIGKADANISSNSTGTVSVFMGAGGSEAATEYDLTCRARFAAVTGSKLAAIALRNGIWYVGRLEC
jgi:hypothetical protein